MNDLYYIIRFLHFMSFVFMTVPLFNLIIVNERAALGVTFDYTTDRYMENIIKNGATRCYVFQTTVLITGILLLYFGDLGIEALWTNMIVLIKTVLLFLLMGLLSYVHFSLQPKIEKIFSVIGPETEIPEGLVMRLKPHRVKRKWVATVCLFLVIVIIILGMQMHTMFDPVVNGVLIILAGLFALKVNKTLIRFGWV